MSTSGRDIDVSHGQILHHDFGKLHDKSLDESDRNKAMAVERRGKAMETDGVLVKERSCRIAKPYAPNKAHFCIVPFGCF